MGSSTPIATDSNFTRAVCKIRGLEHLSFGQCLLNSDACREIESMLGAKNCVLKSLALDDHIEIKDETSMTLIASGMAANKSVKGLRFNPSKTEDITSLI
jgi:hypothetical protein